MENNSSKKLNKQENLLSFKLSLIEKENKNTINDSLINNLLNDFKEIEELLGKNLDNIIKSFYFSKKKIHGILYEEQQLINIESYKIKNNLTNHFYLNLLINDSNTIVNYSYSIDYIKNLNKIQKDLNNKFKEIFIAKCILDLIKNYKELDEDLQDEEKEIINKIEKDNEVYIENNISIFEEINLLLDDKKFKSKNIDEIYSEIIISLITNKIFENYKYTYNIIKDIDLKNIDITEIMFDKLLKLLNSNTNNINEYLILNEEDLYNVIKINFYYILLKFILKNSIYIYQIPALLSTRKLILRNIKSNKILYNNIDEKIKDKFEYIIEKLVDSKYYYQEIDESNLSKLNDILLYYKQFLFESKKEDINLIENIIKYKKGFYKKYLKDYEISVKMNIRFSIIKFLLDKNKNDEQSIEEEEINKFSETWDNYENMIKNKKINEINQNDKTILIEYFNDKNNIDILNNIFKNKEYELLINLNNEKNIGKNANFLDPKESSPNSNNGNGVYSINKIKDEDEEEKINNNSKYNKDDEMKKVSECQSTNSEIGSVNNNFDDIAKDLEKILEGLVYGILINKKKWKKINNQNSSIACFSEFNENNESYENIYENYSFNKLCDSIKNINPGEIKYKPHKKLYDNFVKLKSFIELTEGILEINFKDNSNVTNLGIKLLFNKSKEKSNSNFIYISCRYEIINDKLNLYQDDDILNKDFLNNDIILNSSFCKFINQINNLYNNSEINLSEISKITSQFITSQSLLINNFQRRKIIGEHQDCANYIIEIGNGYLISGSHKDIILYEKDTFKKNQPIPVEHSSILPINNEKKSIDIIINSEEKNITYLNFNQNGKLDGIFKEINCKIKSHFCLYFQSKKDYLICNNEGIYLCNDILGKIIQITKTPVKKNEVFFSGILINDDIAAFTSNKSSSKGHDKIIFYNNKPKRVFNSIEGYSFNKSQNNSVLINENILLCACTKYVSDQKNGILLIKIKDNDEKMPVVFEPTGNFEVYCFCPIVKTTNIIFDDNKKVHNTKYILVGGYDNTKKEGLIKLYELLYKDDLKKIKIVYNRDIEINNKNEKIEKPISCMIQYKKTSNIIITCFDGKVYLFDKILDELSFIKN